MTDFKTEKLLRDGVNYLLDNYQSFNFFYERDISWILQKYMLDRIDKEKLPNKLYCEYDLFDMVVFNDNELDYVVEIKYEPSHERPDIQTKRLKQHCITINDINNDIDKISKYEKVKKGFVIFVDEGSFHQKNYNKIKHEFEEFKNNQITLLLIKLNF